MIMGMYMLVGTIKRPETSYDFALLKYDSSGTLKWRVFYNGPVNGSEILSGIAKDINENIYLTGSSDGNGTGKDYSTLKYDSSGALKWAIRYNGQANNNDEATAITVNKPGSAIIVTGSSETTGQGKNILTLKYNSFGALQMVKSYNGPGNGDDIPRAVALSNNGYLFITGESFGSGTDADIVTIKYSNNFSQSPVVARFNGSANGIDAANAIGIDQQGNVYVAGYSTTMSGKDFSTIKYNNNLGQQWIATYNGTGNNADEGLALSVSGNGIIVSGYSNNSIGNNDYTTIKYMADGTLDWAHIYDGIGEGDDIAHSLFRDKNDNIFVTGTSKACGTKDDFATIKYSNNGEIKWVLRYDNRDSQDDAAYSVSVNNEGKVFASGMSFNGETYHITTVKYSPDTTNKEKDVQDIREALELLAIGLKDISKNGQIKQIVNDVVSQSIDNYYFILLSRLFEEGLKIGIDVMAEMNQTIAIEKSLTPGRDYVSKLLKVVQKSSGTPHIAIPHFKRFTQADLAKDPKLAYLYKHGAYPLPCVNCADATIKLPDTKFNSTWILATEEGPEYYLDGDPLIYLPTSYYCQFYSNATYCNTCRTVAPSFDDIPFSGGTTGDHEIALNINADNCMEPGDYYLKLSKIAGMNYWNFKDISSAQIIKKINHPIEDRTGGNLVVGDVLKICNNQIFYAALDLPNTGDYGLSMGGVFKAVIPGMNLLSVYFSFPYTQYFWYSQGPDMGINYKYLFTGDYCPDGKSQIVENFSLSPCEFCDVAPNVFGVTTDVIASTALAPIEAYWKSNVITVGIGIDFQTPAFSNLAEFTAINSPTGCTPVGTLLGTLKLNPDESYEVMRESDSNINPTMPITIYVRANYKDGSSINECKTVQLTYSQINTYNVRAQIRGNIKDYNSSIINYQVEIYQ